MLGRKKQGQRVVPRCAAIPVSAKTRQRDVDIVQARLSADELLSLADECDRGTDPYNCTGQFSEFGSTGNN